MQGWLFQDTTFWHPEQIKAMLTSVPEVSIIICNILILNQEMK
jgi:hypothetical protein